MDQLLRDGRNATRINTTKDPLQSTRARREAAAERLWPEGRDASDPKQRVG
jgi:hypothetical protein